MPLTTTAILHQTGDKGPPKAKDVSNLGIFFTRDQPCFVSTRLHFPYSFLFVCFGLWKSQSGLLWCVAGIWGLLGWAPLWW